MGVAEVVKDGIRMGELEKIERYLKENLGELWDIEISEDIDGKHVKAEYSDSYEMETIRIYVEVNDYGVPRYRVETEYAHRDNEIITCDSCHEPNCKECDLFDEIKDDSGECVDLRKHDRYVSEEIRKHESKGRVVMSDLDDNIIVYPTVVEVECHVNVSHLHLYRGVGINAELFSFERVKALLEMRNFLYSLIDCS